jgi:hypothetical protein
MRRMPLLVASGLLIAAVIGLPLQAAAPPPKNLAQLRHEVAVLKAKVQKLTARNKNLAASNALAKKREDALARHILGSDSCPITRPNGSIPPSVSGSGWHGNGSVWIEFPSPLNVVVLQRAGDGSLETKFPWWRSASGILHVTGMRLDGPSPPLTADVPSGYGDTGIQPTRLRFPTEGCWQVTGQVGETSLTVVTLVLGI